MSKELANEMEKSAMELFWDTVTNKPYPKILGVWENREKLPTTYKSDFDPNGVEKLTIPLQGNGYIKLGKTDSNEMELGLDVKFPTARGDNEMIETSTIVTPVTYDSQKGRNYPFWIFFDDGDDPIQRELMKALSRFDPEKDIDWEKIEQGSTEMTIALSLCKYADDKGKPYEKSISLINSVPAE